ncbi:CsgG/HfaB family protein [Candidatus Neomarinimicrobiota bacterium]
MKIYIYLIFIPLHFLISQVDESIAVMDLDGRGISNSEVLSLTDRLRTALVRTGKATVVERSQMQQVMAEQDFQMTGCTTNECAIEIGQLLGVTRMVAGSIGKVGSTFSIDLRIIDIQTGRILESYARDYRGEIDGLLNEMTSIAGLLVGFRQDHVDGSKAGAEVKPKSDESPKRRSGKGFRPVGNFDVDKAIAGRGRTIQVGDVVFAYRKDTKKIDKGLVQRLAKSSRRMQVHFEDGDKSIQRADAIRAHVALKRLTGSTGLNKGDKVILYSGGFKRGLVGRVLPTGEVAVHIRYGQAGGTAARPVIAVPDQLLIWAKN